MRPGVGGACGIFLRPPPLRGQPTCSLHGEQGQRHGKGPVVTLPGADGGDGVPGRSSQLDFSGFPSGCLEPPLLPGSQTCTGAALSHPHPQPRPAPALDQQAPGRVLWADSPGAQFLGTLGHPRA